MAKFVFLDLIYSRVMSLEFQLYGSSNIHSVKSQFSYQFMFRIKFHSSCCAIFVEYFVSIWSKNHTISLGEYRIEIVNSHSFLTCSAKKTSKIWFSFLYHASHFVDSKKSCSVSDKTLADRSVVSYCIHRTKNARRIPITIIIAYFEIHFKIFISKI